MTKTRITLSVLSLTAAGLLGCAAASLPVGAAVPQPVDYRDWHHVKSMVIQPGHALHDAFGGIHHIYANPAARAGLASGNYADGAVFAFDLLEANTSGNAIAEGQRKVLGVMHRSAAAFPDTGGWGFAGFTDDGTNVVKDMRKQCFECHQSQQARGYVFTQSRP